MAYDDTFLNQNKSKTTTTVKKPTTPVINPALTTKPVVTTPVVKPTTPVINPALTTKPVVTTPVVKPTTPVINPALTTKPVVTPLPTPVEKTGYIPPILFHPGIPTAPQTADDRGVFTTKPIPVAPSTPTQVGNPSYTAPVYVPTTPGAVAKPVTPVATPPAVTEPQTPVTVPTAPVSAGGISPLTPELIGQPLGDKYGLTYDMGQIKSILDGATKGIYDNKNEAFKTTENNFYNQMGGLQAESIDALKKTQAAAVATGASKGMAAANELSAILGLQEQTAPLSNDLANQRNLLASEEAAAYSKNAATALDTSNAIKQAIANLDLTKYGYDTQESIGIMDYLAALADIEGNKYAADQTLIGVKYNADSNLAGTKYSSSSGGSSGYGSGTGAGSSVSPIGAPYTLPNQRYTITNNSDGTAVINGYVDEKGVTYGAVTITAEELAKLKNNNGDIDSIKDGTTNTWGAFSRTASGEMVDESKITTPAQALAFANRWGKLPAGWAYGQGASGVYKTGTAGGTSSGASTVTNTVTFDGSGGTTYSIGQGTGASTWKYNKTTGMWSSSFGTTKNMADFKKYFDSQNGLYIRQIGANPTTPTTGGGTR